MCLLWVISLSVISSRSTHLVTDRKVSFFFYGQWVFHCTQIPHLPYLIIYRWIRVLRLLLTLTIVNNDAFNIVALVQLLSRVDSLQPRGLQHTRFPCPSSSTWVCSNSRPLSQWCHPNILSSVAPFFFCTNLS